MARVLLMFYGFIIKKPYTSTGLQNKGKKAHKRLEWGKKLTTFLFVVIG